MIIKTDYPLLADGLERVEYISDSGYCIRKVGSDELYDSAVELASANVKYEETDIIAENTATTEDYQNALAEFGVAL